MKTTNRLLLIAAIGSAGTVGGLTPPAYASTAHLISVPSVCRMQYANATGAILTPGANPPAYGWNCTEGGTVLGGANMQGACDTLYPGSLAEVRQPSAESQTPTWTCASA